MSALSVAAIVDAARARTGLDTFDCDSYVEGLTLALDEVRRGDGESNPLLSSVVDAFGACLDNRLRVAAYLRENPDVLDAQIIAPVFVAGSPRTGTTALSYMLDCDPAWRSLLKWEASDSVPPPTTETLRTDPRCAALNEVLRARMAAMTEPPMHWEWADGPTECNHLHAQDFHSQVTHTFIPTRRYRELLLHGDYRPTFEYQKRVLQVLQSQAPGRWVLKSPSHALCLDALVDVFPDAHVVVVHRDPFDVVASLLEMRTAFAGVVDRSYSHVIEDTPAYVAEHCNRPDAFRARRPEVPVLDLYLADLVTDPISELRRVYAWLGVPLDGTVEAAMVAWLASDSQRQARRSRPKLEDHGFRRGDLEPLFEPYLAAHPEVLDGARRGS